jgi:OHCU decarboxylase
MGAEGLARFNALPLAVARDLLLGCCSSVVWAERMASGRPYSSAMDAARQSSAIVARLSVPDLEAALAGHAGRVQQARDAQAAGEVADALREYEQRFGHVYLAAASAQSGPQQLAALQARLGNRQETEWRVIRTELQKINAMRLRELLAGSP